MELRNHETHVSHSFDCFCKKVLKRRAIDIQRHAKWRIKHEITFSDMPAQELSALSVTDEYFAFTCIFDLLGVNVGVMDSNLAKALNTLPADRRDIILMSYFFDMTDKEIAEQLNMARRTVAHYRTSSLQKLKSLLESEE